MDIEIATTTEEIATRAAERVAALARASVAERAVCHVAFSGGRTPGLMFTALLSMEVPWRELHVWQVDERIAPASSPDRNLTQLQQDLLRRAPIPPANIHPMPVEAADLDEAASSYAAELHQLADGVLDVVHLGLGDDGHTASWPPHHPILEARQTDVAVVGPFHGTMRMTLTPPAVNRARAIFFLVTGRDKAQVVSQLLGGNRALPASRVRSEGTVLLAGGGAEAGTVAWRASTTRP
jgi:6-phosphogluconolactonase